MLGGGANLLQHTVTLVTFLKPTALDPGRAPRGAHPEKTLSREAPVR